MTGQYRALTPMRYVWVTEMRIRRGVSVGECAQWTLDSVNYTRAQAMRQRRATRDDNPQRVSGTRMAMYYNADDVQSEIEAVKEECAAIAAEEVRRTREIECEPFAQLVDAWAPVVRAARAGKADLAMALAAKLDKEQVP